MLIFEKGKIEVLSTLLPYSKAICNVILIVKLFKLKLIQSGKIGSNPYGKEGKVV